MVHFYTGGNERFSEDMCDQNLNDERGRCMAFDKKVGYFHIILPRLLSNSDSLHQIQLLTTAPIPSLKLCQ